MAIQTYSRSILYDVEKWLACGHSLGTIIAALESRGIDLELAHRYVDIAKANFKDMHFGIAPSIHYSEKSRGFRGFLKRLGL